MFDKILIANRGEIACRVIKTARSMGVATVAIYSDPDCGARHVEMADEAVRIGPAPVAESYLQGGRIIQAALASGAEAVHPGYGFLSENPEFVDAVAAAGLVFIGPSAAAIRSMGLKDAAKSLMQRAGVPVVPGYHGADQDDLKSEAARIGYPLMIKAVAGGGGKGMRHVTRPEEFSTALESARAEARSAFGNDRVLLEKFIEKPRHIEIQVFGDGQKMVHLFERDCSLQRRHQKVIEEAPAPGMTDEMRAAMGTAAVRAAQAIGYSGAGTVEFIVDVSDGLRVDRFWFMEMNTRLQVEHPVTEAVTGIDLVEWQLRIAAGEALPCSQQQLELNGHSIEARLYAEDAENGFLPATGTLRHLKFPDAVRVDTGVRNGDVISPYYDPMIAKIIAHGPTRAVALSRLRSALSAVEIAGTITNLTFLRKLVRNPEFTAGQVDTDLITRHQDVLCRKNAPSLQVVAMAALAATQLLDADQPQAGFTLWAPLRRAVRLKFSDQEYCPVLRVSDANNVVVTIDDAQIQLCKIGGAWTEGGRRTKARAVRMGNLVIVFGDDTYEFEIPDDLAVSSDVHSGEDIIRAPMPGLVRQIFVRPGAEVAQGDRIAVLEAMKMEHTLKAPRPGTISEVLVKQGTQVEAGAALVRLEEVE